MSRTPSGNFHEYYEGKELLFSDTINAAVTSLVCYFRGVRMIWHLAEKLLEILPSAMKDIIVMPDNILEGLPLPNSAIKVADKVRH